MMNIYNYYLDLDTKEEYILFIGFIRESYKSSKIIKLEVKMICLTKRPPIFIFFNALIYYYRI